jgi:hypothetical protein
MTPDPAECFFFAPDVFALAGKLTIAKMPCIALQHTQRSNEVTCGKRLKTVCKLDGDAARP